LRVTEVSDQFGIEERNARLGTLIAERRSISLWALLAVNLVPLLGVIVWGWDVASVMILYWSENLIIGFYTVVKMLVKNPVGGIFMSAFFTIHYGGFCAVHGIFVLSLTTGEMPEFLSGDSWPLFLVFVQLLFSVIGHVLSMAPPQWILGFVALGVSHGISLLLNYFAGGEHRGQDLKTLMHAPYKRVVVLHVATIAGAFGVAAFESPLPLLLILVILKTGLDVWLHRREHASRPEEKAATGP
jgi:hypothetical protein